MTNSTQIKTGLKIGKATALKMGGQVFFANKRVTEVHLRTYNKLVVMTYRGSRKDENEVMAGVEIVRVVKLENLES